jgi:vitamin B12/bleomycin/antimicrobial peptide transport system ATP-binding/permease protein
MSNNEQRRPNRWFRDFWKLARPFWTSEKWPIAVLFSLGIFGYAGVTAIYVNVVINKANGALVNSIANRNSSEFYNSILTLIEVAILWNLIGQTGHYLRYRLKLMWREWMTRRFLELWFKNQRHYFWNLTQKKGTDNPDQRISQDIEIFINTTEQLTVDLFENVLTVFTYGAILWSLSGVLTIPLGDSMSFSLPGYLMWLCLGFAAASNISVYFVGKKLIPLEYEQQHREADFRSSLMKMREHSEVIALARGEEAEIQGAMSRFDLIVTNFRSIITKFIHLELFKDVHIRVRKLCVALAAAPRVFSGIMTVGAFTQTMEAFIFLEDSTSVLVDVFRSFADWRSSARRLVDFEESLSRAGIVQSQTKTSTSSDSIKTEDLEVLTPDGRRLIDGVCLEIRERERVLFKAKSGAGKSTVFKIMAGIWPFKNGRIQGPAQTDSLFLSQVPYLPQGTLRQTLLYPNIKLPVTNEVLGARLKQFGLAHLIEKLDVDEDWQKILSPGEQQRIVLIRALLLKPKWLFLDEATTALDEHHQNLAYETLTNELKNTSIISISHQRELEGFHQRIIDLSPQGDRPLKRKIS